MKHYYIAQINVGRALGDMDSPVMQGFVSRLQEINALAEASKGFVWRLQTEEGDSTAIRVFDDPSILVNMSVWETIDDLKHYVYRTAHVELLQDREAWFSKLAEVHQALWWVPAGHLPTPEEGRDKLLYLRQNGSSKEVFSMAKPFPQPAHLEQR